MAVLRYSRQREAIKENLAGRKDHPTAEMVYESIRQMYPNISLGTVYRNLSLLAELGEIRKLDGMGGSDHFDGRTDFHTHFMCESCGQVIDLENDQEFTQFIHTTEQKFPGKILGCSTRFFGICECCMKKQS